MQQSSSGQVPTYDINITVTVIIVQNNRMNIDNEQFLQMRYRHDVCLSVRLGRACIATIWCILARI